jgi:formylglycine-generating enzyme
LVAALRGLNEQFLGSYSGSNMIQQLQFLFCISITSIAFADDGLPLGIVRERPTTGYSVALEDGTWMVAYQHPIRNKTMTFEMIPIPGGRIQIGAPETEAGRRDDEGPTFEVELPPFWMSKTEVTWNEFRDYQLTYSNFKDRAKKIKIETIKEDEPSVVTAPTPIYEESLAYEFGRATNPVMTVSQYGAKQYTKWLSLTHVLPYRLPTEVEWEYACRAGSETSYHFGDDPNQLNEFAKFWTEGDDAVFGTLPVASKKPNAFGLYDMHGNVREWVIDTYEADGHRTRAKQDLNQRSIPNFGTTRFPHVLKGGGWLDPPELQRSATRFASSDSLSDEDPDNPQSPHWLASEEGRSIGFRIVRSLVSESPEELAKFWNASADLRYDVELRIEEGRGVVTLTESHRRYKSAHQQ